MPNRAELLAAWSTAHAGVHPSAPVRLWLRGCWVLARPLAALRVPPDALTFTGLLCALRAINARGLGAAGWLAASVACDAMDGAVALHSGVHSAHGPVLDRMADRCAEACFAIMLVRRGGRSLVPCVAYLLTLRHEVGRTGTPAASVITVAERPTRVLCGLAPLITPRRHTAGVATAASWIWLLAELSAAWQLRGLRATGRPVR